MRPPRPPALPARALALFALLAWACVPAAAARAQPAARARVLDAGAHHLRSGPRPEWRDSAGHAHARRLALDFAAAPNAAERTLALRQEDVKQRWRVLLNGRSLGLLHQDENAIVAYWAVPAGTLVAGTNRLRVEPADSAADDVWVGEVALHDAPLAAVLAESAVEVEVVDAASGAPIPARVTVADARGRLQTLGAANGVAAGGATAVRPGLVYTADGRAAFGLPAGIYRVYATRGFEWGVDSARLVLRPGDRARRRLAIAREVPTDGWVASDTHVHTLTHSGHGDATAAERVLSLAGEGVELPVVTEHNVQADLDSLARALGVRAHFTPVVGNEVTTRVGHFNVFPLALRAPAPDAAVRSWDAAFRAIEGTGAGVVILNHARDVHAGFRPFGAERHIAVAGASRDGWVLRANAMEVVNSGAQLAEPRRLLDDWLAMLNRGHRLAPVGASDSHDVGRYLVGQARTYVRADDRAPDRIDVAAAVERFRAGAVMASFGLLAELTVEERHGPGDLVPVAGDSLTVRVRVLGPAWTRAERVTLHANGRPVRAARIADGRAAGRAAGVKWSGTWRLARPAHDVSLVAVAEGPGERLPFWPIARPYQHDAPDRTARVLGASGAAWIDADGDGRGTDAHAYAVRLLADAGSSLDTLMRALASFDDAVAVQAAALLLDRGVLPSDAAVRGALRRAAPATRRGFAAFAADWRASELAAERARGGR